MGPSGGDLCVSRTCPSPICPKPKMPSADEHDRRRSDRVRDAKCCCRVTSFGAVTPISRKCMLRKVWGLLQNIVMQAMCRSKKGGVYLTGTHPLLNVVGRERRIRRISSAPVTCVSRLPVIVSSKSPPNSSAHPSIWSCNWREHRQGVERRQKDKREETVDPHEISSQARRSLEVALIPNHATGSTHGLRTQ